MHIPDQVLSAIFGGSMVGNAWGIVHWTYRRVRNRQINEAFIEEMATVHLPYLYRAVVALCDKSGVDIGDHPNIGFLRLNGVQKNVKKIS